MASPMDIRGSLGSQGVDKGSARSWLGPPISGSASAAQAKLELGAPRRVNPLKSWRVIFANPHRRKRLLREAKGERGHGKRRQFKRRLAVGHCDVLKFNRLDPIWCVIVIEGIGRRSGQQFAVDKCGDGHIG